MPKMVTLFLLCLYKSFQHKMYVNVSTGLVMQVHVHVQVVSITLRVKKHTIDTTTFL